MIQAPFRLEPRSAHQRQRLQAILRRFQERAFGEELARVNLDLSEAERIAYVSWMRETSRQHGIDLRAQSTHAWMDRLEEQLAREAVENAGA